MARLGRDPTSAFAAVLTRAGRDEQVGAGRLLGLEHEYTVSGARGQVDFRDLIRRLEVDGRRVDPGDSNAFRLRWGGVLTADGAEAEVAIPPLPAEPGFGQRLVAAAERGRAALDAVLPQDASAEGFSTHISTSTPEERTASVAREFAQRFAAPQMLLMDRADSPGLLVRPRLGRLELGAEYVTGDQLRAAAVFATGATRALARRGPRRRLPPRVVADVRRAKQRDGWYVDRAAFGTNVLDGGRSARLTQERGGSITAQEQLEDAWSVAREALGTDATTDDIATVDRLVSGTSPLPLEAVAAHTGPTALDTSHEPDLISTRVRPTFVLAIELATWAFAIFRVWNGVRRAYASVPRRALAPFLALLEAGELDGLLTDFLADRPRGRVLRDWRQAATAPGLFDGLGAREGFVTPEIDVFGRPLPVGGGGKARRDTTTVVPPPLPPKPPGLPAWLFPVAGVVAVIGVLLVIAFALGFFGGGAPPVAVGSPTPAQSAGPTSTTGIPPTPSSALPPTPSAPPTPTASPTAGAVFASIDELLDYLSNETGTTIGTPEERAAAIVPDPLNDFFKWDGGPVDVDIPIDISAGAVISAGEVTREEIDRIRALCGLPPATPAPGEFSKQCGDGVPDGPAAMYIVIIEFSEPPTVGGNISLFIDSDGDPANNPPPNDDFPLAPAQSADQLIQLFPDAANPGTVKLQLYDYTDPGQVFAANAILYFGAKSAAFVVFGYEPGVKFLPAVEVFEGLGDFQDDILGPQPVVGDFPPGIEPYRLGIGRL